jgi:GIY-YIG catalytic domain
MEPNHKSKEAPAKTGASVIFTIYCHKHIDSGRVYIGLTSKKWQRRWSEHLTKAKDVHKKLEAKSKLGSTKSKSPAIINHWYNALTKYGPGAFSHEILEQCSSLEEANAAEIKWIDHYDSTNPEKGFNIARGGLHTPHPIANPWERPEYVEKAKRNNNIRHCLTPEARAKQIASLNTPESRAKRSQKTRESMASPAVQEKRRKFQEDPEYRGRISESLKSSLSSEDARRAMSERTRSQWQDPESKSKLVRAMRDKASSPEVKEKVSRTSREHWLNPEYRAKQQARQTSEETRQKLSRASTGFRHSDESRLEMRRLFGERRARLLSESGFSTWSEYIAHTIRSRKSVNSSDT